MGVPILLPSFGTADSATFNQCLFLTNLMSEMADTWMNTTPFPTGPGEFTWCPTNENCTNNFGITVNDFAGVTQDDLIWSTFITKKNGTVIEPFGCLFQSVSNQDWFLVFRGSKTPADGSADAEYATENYLDPFGQNQGIEVEQGFYSVYKGLLNSTDSLSLNQCLKTLLPKIGNNKLTVTGHSLGSAVATLVIPQALQMGFTQKKLQNYNSGSPMVGLQTWANYYDKFGVTTFRLVNTEDSVPKCPPTILKVQPLTFVHVGSEIDFTAAYSTEAQKHSPCCSYAYAVSQAETNPKNYNPVNPDMDTC